MHYAWRSQIIVKGFPKELLQKIFSSYNTTQCPVLLLLSRIYLAQTFLPRQNLSLVYMYYLDKNTSAPEQWYWRTSGCRIFREMVNDKNINKNTMLINKQETIFKESFVYLCREFWWEKQPTNYCPARGKILID